MKYEVCSVDPQPGTRVESFRFLPKIISYIRRTLKPGPGGPVVLPVFILPVQSGTDLQLGHKAS
uniref:Uncharacterized protein n=1 Tax=Anguilla anguilla TaxID=7936 RepID=A0A0E9V5Z1_ANGAN